VRPTVASFVIDGRTAIPAYLTTAEAAAILGVTPPTIRTYVSQDKLASRANGAFRVSSASVLAYQSGKHHAAH
jgi:hypothetical protein